MYGKAINTNSTLHVEINYPFALKALFGRIGKPESQKSGEWRVNNVIGNNGNATNFERKYVHNNLLYLLSLLSGVKPHISVYSLHQRRRNYCLESLSLNRFRISIRSIYCLVNLVAVVCTSGFIREVKQPTSLLQEYFDNSHVVDTIISMTKRLETYFP